ncbi:MAG: Lrp/AsnC family transcriptional regulator [Halobacteriaceae archaeon]
MDPRRELLELLVEDARYDVEELAAQTDLDVEAVEAHLADLEAEGVIQGYQAVVDWDRVDTEHVRAIVELNVALDRETGYDDISGRIARYPAVDSLRLVSGDFDFAVEVVGDSIHDVSTFVAEQIAPIPEVTQTVTHFVMTTYKDSGVEFREETEDDRLSVSP